MTNKFKRRIYRFSLIGTTCILIGLFLYDLQHLDIVTMQLDFLCYILIFAGIISGFKALETWSSWIEDESEDTDEEEYARNSYPSTFYIEAGIIALIAVLLLAWPVTRRQPDSQEQLVTIFSLLVAGICVLLGHLSSYLA